MNTTTKKRISEVISEEIDLKKQEHKAEKSVLLIGAGDPVIEENRNIYRTLKDIGIVNASFNKELEQEDNLILQSRQENNFTSALNSLIQFYPKNRIISYPDLHSVLVKYDLFLGPLAAYTKEIPKDKAQQLIELFEYEKRKFTTICNNYVLDSYSNFKDSVKIGTLAGMINKNPDLGNIEAHYSYSNQSFGYYIVAPKTDFVKKDSYLISREICYSSISKGNFKLSKINFTNPFTTTTNALDSMVPKDPIIVRPWQVKGKLYFVIGPAWDREQFDPKIFNHIVN